MTKGKELAEALGVTPEFDVDAEISRRVSFLADYLRGAGCRAYVLGISGGVDSLAAGLLAQRAVKDLRASGHEASFIAVRLPCGVQWDEVDAQQALSSIQPDRLVSIDISPATVLSTILGAIDLGHFIVVAIQRVPLGFSGMTGWR